MFNRFAQFLDQQLFKPIDPASVAIFRIGFGVVLLGHAASYLFGKNLDALYVQTTFKFRYFGFEWVPILGDWVYLMYTLMALGAVGMALGVFYRAAGTLCAGSLIWIFLQDRMALYLNHVYLLILFNLLLVAIPAHRYWSIFALRNPQESSSVLPSWCRLVLILQLEVLLIYAGIVKLNPDWLRLEPLATWLAERESIPVLGWFFVQTWAVAMGAYGVIALHMIGAPLLLLRATRLYVLAIYTCFHITNVIVFDIGVFPWVTLFASLICFDADWPRQIWARLANRYYTSATVQSLPTDFASRRVLVVALLGVWMTLQILIPARPLLYEGEVAWTELGHRFSWRMLLRSKRGEMVFGVFEPEKEKLWLVVPTEILSSRQIGKMTCRPDMILQMAHYLRDNFEVDGQVPSNLEVRVKGNCSLNGRESAPLIDPDVDLAQVQRTLGNSDWILPLTKPPKRS